MKFELIIIIILIFFMFSCSKVQNNKKYLNNIVPISNNNYYKQLKEAIDNGDQFRIDDLISKNNLDINYFDTVDKYPFNPLVEACKRNNLEIIKYLINKGALVNPKRLDYDSSPLITACNQGNFEITEYLINKNANINDKVIQLDGNLTTPLSSATLKNYSKIVLLLINNGVNSEDIKYSFLEGCLNNSLDSVKILHKKIDNINYSGNIGWIGELTPLMCSIIHNSYVKNKSYTTFNYLLLNGADINYVCKSNDYNSLIVATVIQDFNIIKILVDKGIDLNQQYNNPTFLFSQNFEDKIIPNSASPLMIASILGNEEIVKFLVNSGADKKLINKEGKSALDYAKENNQTLLLKYLEF